MAYFYYATATLLIYWFFYMVICEIGRLPKHKWDTVGTFVFFGSIALSVVIHLAVRDVSHGNATHGFYAKGSEHGLALFILFAVDIALYLIIEYAKELTKKAKKTKERISNEKCS